VLRLLQALSPPSSRAFQGIDSNPREKLISSTNQRKRFLPQMPRITADVPLTPFVFYPRVFASSAVPLFVLPSVIIRVHLWLTSSVFVFRNSRLETRGVNARG
jgi:hypothetical protein